VAPALAEPVPLPEAQPRPAAREEAPSRPDALDHGLGLATLRRFLPCHHPGDPRAVHLFHPQQEAGEAYLVAGLRGAS